MLTTEPDGRPKEGPADDGKEYAPRFMRPCVHYTDADPGGPAWCGATPTRHGPNGPACADHVPAQPKPDPTRTIEGLRAAAAAAAPEPEPEPTPEPEPARPVVPEQRPASPDAAAEYRAARAALESAT